MIESSLTTQHKNSPGQALPLYPRIFDALSRRRYFTERLQHHLEEKLAAFRQDDFARADTIETRIARLSRDIVFSMEETSSLLAGRSVEDYAGLLPEDLEALLLSLAAETGRLEWLCLKALNGITLFLKNRETHVRQPVATQSASHRQNILSMAHQPAAIQ